ncbi:hypothetical protein HPP92_002092 [Vanilla planifolia]|uniref:Copper amine oxidase N3-terminal domain-containing protein n=1 Tax=Vanilla planifolia TaxID=51239 RepID=A0A835RZJ0_VANPL|nr:hypothetical protein HPP92_002092 [Vanilla planifolia]
MVTCMPPMYHPILSTLSPSARSPPFTPSQPPTLLLPSPTSPPSIPFPYSNHRKSAPDPHPSSAFHSPGWFGPAEENRQLAKVQCYAIGPNFYMRPLEGLTALVDVDTARGVWNRDVEQDNVPPVPVGREPTTATARGGQPHGCRLRGLEEGRDSRWRGT